MSEPTRKSRQGRELGPEIGITLALLLVRVRELLFEMSAVNFQNEGNASLSISCDACGTVAIRAQPTRTILVPHAVCWPKPKTDESVCSAEHVCLDQTDDTRCTQFFLTAVKYIECHSSSTQMISLMLATTMHTCCYPQVIK